MSGKAYYRLHQFVTTQKKGTETAPLGSRFGKRELSLKGLILRVAKQFPKGAVLVPLIFLSDGSTQMLIGSAQRRSHKPT